MIVVHRILNAFAETFGLKETMDAVRAWIGQKDAEIFLAANPGLRFGNAGLGAALCPTPSVCADGSCACLDDTSSGGGAALGASPSGFAAAPSGPALCHTPNGKGRYSWYSGIPDVEPEVSTAAFAVPSGVNPYDAPTPEDTAKVAQALIDLSTASTSDDTAVVAATQAFAGLSVTPSGL